MLKAFAKNSVIYYISSILTKGISFMLLPLYTSLLSSDDYGALELVSIFSTIVIIIFSFQINQGIARFYYELKNKKLIQIYTSSVTLFSLFSFSTSLVIGLFFSKYIANYSGVSPLILNYAFISIAINGMFYLTQSQLKWKIKPIQDTIASLTYNLVTILFTIYFLAYLKQGLVSIFKAQIAGGTFAILVCVIFSYQDYNFYFSWKVIKKLLNFSLPLLPAALSTFLFMFTDKICIKEMLSLNDLGIYAVGGKIASILTFASFGIGAALSPLIYKYYKEKDTPLKLSKILSGYLFFAFIIIFFITIFADDILRKMTTVEYVKASVILPFLLLSLLFNSLNQFFPGLVISKKIKIIGIVTFFSGVLNLILNVFLIRFYGLYGAACSTLLAYILNFSFLFYFSQKEYYIYFDVKKVVAVIFIFTLITVFQISPIFEKFVWRDWFLLKVALYIISCIIIFVAFFNVKDIYFYKEKILSSIKKGYR